VIDVVHSVEERVPLHAIIQIAKNYADLERFKGRYV
jgi:hypothetical protein